MLDSIRSKLITIFISFTLIPLILLGVFLIWQNYIVRMAICCTRFYRRSRIPVTITTAAI